MRLGVVDMLPKDFRTCTLVQIQAITALGFTGFGCHLDRALAFEITAVDCAAFHGAVRGGRARAGPVQPSLYRMPVQRDPIGSRSK